MFFYNSSIDFEAHFRHKGFFAESDLKNRARGSHASTIPRNKKGYHQRGIPSFSTACRPIADCPKKVFSRVRLSQVRPLHRFRESQKNRRTGKARGNQSLFPRCAVQGSNGRHENPLGQGCPFGLASGIGYAKNMFPKKARRFFCLARYRKQ